MYNGITYGWRNTDNGKMYIGYHKTTEVDDGYIFSTEDPEANTAWQYGKLRRHIIYKGDQSIAITLENFLLKHVKAIKNPQFYNRSVGGGVGCVTDFSNLTDDVKQVGIDWINGIDPKLTTAVSKVDKAEIRQLKEDVNSGKYFVHPNESVKELYNLPRIQVRENLEEIEHMEQIAERMMDNPAKARENISPVVIVRFTDGTKSIVDGNNTIGAAHKAKWTEVPAVYLNSSEFKDKLCNMKWFGYAMNHSEKIKKPNSKTDLRKAIIDFTDTHPNLQIGTEDFKDAFKDAYGEFWTSKQIAATITTVKNNLETWQQIKNNNFKVYSDDELKQIVVDLETEFPGTAIISSSISGCYNSGIGGIMNKMGGIGHDCWNAIMVISYRSMDDYKRGAEYLNKLNEAKKRLHPDVNLQLKILEPFNGLSK